MPGSRECIVSSPQQVLLPQDGGAGDSSHRADPSLLKRLASLRLTLWLIALLAAGIAAAYRLEGMRTWPMVVPLVLLSLNLIAAIATNGVFRRQMPLLVFHLSLVILLLLVAAGRLTYLNGHVGVTEGSAFDGVFAESERGPLHPDGTSDLHFVNKGFTIEYRPGLQRGPTRNLVGFRDTDGRWHEQIVGDQTPLVLSGYRFYTSFNKGFAPTFRWIDADGNSTLGSVQLPPFPLNEYSQAAEWTPPGSGEAVWIMLDIDEVVLDPDDHTSFRLPERFRLIARVGEQRHEMQPGDSLVLSRGTLHFEGLRTWMGYRVFYDWTLPWLLAACGLAVVSLGAHFWNKFSKRPWDA